MVQSMHVQVPLEVHQAEMDYSAMAPNFIYQHPEGEDIDLGLTLSTSLQQGTYNHPPGRYSSPSECGEMMGWPQVTPYQKSSNMGHPAISEEDDDETQGVQSKERWPYVKVNMDGVIIGRKVCIFDHTDYSGLALELEHMFGRQYASGLRLLDNDSGFSLFYQDRNEKWRTVGDVPWNLPDERAVDQRKAVQLKWLTYQERDFIDSVKRLRIAPKG
ncbi:hypothetical protein MRB53_024339 [Persea americana]|uniref:Uncharacterized protein n=1 Tax=Persea americana TaxID=3435 RepID=A0ACC2LBX8_PERAE|nr:hypothetical protein MRB53_024339 [Persea americana]